MLVKPGAWFALNDCLYPNAHRWGWGFTNKRCHKFDWYAGEPVYHQKGDYNCGVFWSTYQYHWHVDSCMQRNYYVCEMKLVRIFRDENDFQITMKLSYNTFPFFFSGKTLQVSVLISWTF